MMEGQGMGPCTGYLGNRAEKQGRQQGKRRCRNMKRRKADLGIGFKIGRIRGLLVICRW